MLQFTFENGFIETKEGNAFKDKLLWTLYLEIECYGYEFQKPIMKTQL
jgi:hypothetical protein